MFRNRSIRYKFFMSYLVILIPAILFFIFLNNSFIQSLEKEIRSNNMMQLQQLCNRFEQEMKALSDISDRISVDNTLSNFNMNSDEYAALKGINELKKYKAGDTFINDLLICYGEDDIFSTQGRNDFDVYASAVKGFNEKSRSTLWSALYYENFRSLSVLSRTGQAQRAVPAYIYYNCPIPSSTTLHAQTVGFLIDVSTLEYLMRITLRDYNGFTNLVLDSGTVAAEVNNTENDSQELLQYIRSRQQDTSEFKYKGTPYILMSVRSEYLGCRFNIAIETRQIYTSLAQVRQVSFIVLCLLIVVSVLIAGRLTTTNYKPIKTLRDALKIRTISIDGSKNEFVAIQNAISHTIYENEAMGRKLLEYRPILLQQTNTLLFSGVLKDEEFVARMIRLNGIQFYYNYYCVCSVSVPKADQEAMTGLLDKFSNISEYLCCDISYPTMLEGGFRVAVMLNMAEEDRSWLFRSEIGSEMHKAIRESGYENSKIGFGKVYDRLTMLSQSYMEAIVALEGCVAPSLDEAVMFFENMAWVDTSACWFSREDQFEFINSLKQRDMNKITCSFQKITTSIAEMHLTQKIQRFVCYNIIHIVFDTLLEMGLNQAFTPHLLSLEFMTLDDFANEMKSLFHTLCLAKEEQKPASKKLWEDLLDYIHKHYRDSDLALEGIAQEFNISKFYLSRFFKENMGENYIDYISKLRIQEAKRLLKEDCLSVKDVIQHVGYFDVASFNKKFKREVGISAREYRILCQQGSDL